MNAQHTLEPQYVNPVTIRSDAPPMNGPTIFAEGTPHVSGMSSGYQLPIKLPDAIADFIPELSINYNTSYENGLMGVNWALGGQSAISRASTFLGFDGEIKRHNLNSGVFNLDSDRLIFKGISSQYGIEFTTLSESYIKVYRTNDGFISDDKNGIRRYYGYTQNSVNHINDNNGTAVPYTWHLTKMIAREGGNTIEYEYLKDPQTGEVLLSKVFYNYNVISENFETEIHFTYMKRYDEQTYFTLGNKRKASRILKEINVFHMSNPTPYSSYVFDYTFDQTPKTGNDVSRLVRINVDINGETLTPILITYPEKAPEYVYRPVNINVDEGDHFSQTIFTDVDNDGYDDILTLHRRVSISTCYRNGSTHDNRRHHFTVKLSLNNGNGTYSRSVDVTSEFTSQLYLKSCERYPYTNLHTGDFNGDGLIDILVHRVTILNEKNHHYAYIYKNQGNGRFQFERSFEIYNLKVNGVFQTTDRDISNAAPFFTHVEININDFDGDGISDIGIYRENWEQSLQDPSQYFYSSSEYSVRYFNDDFSSHVEVFQLGSRQLMIKTFGDFNGDGVQDIVFAEKNHYQSHIYSFVNRQRNILNSNSLPNRIHAMYPGDFNGDGITDLLTIHDEPSNNNCDACDWRIRLFNENEFEPNQTIDINGNSLTQQLRKVMDGNTQLNGYRYPPYVFVNDIDGDGRSDINLMLVISYNQFTTTIRFVNFFNKVTGWERTEHIFVLPFGRQTIEYMEQSNRVFLGLFSGKITSSNPLLFRDYQLDNKFHWAKIDDHSEQSLLFYLNAQFFSEKRMTSNHPVRATFRIDFRPNDISNRVHQIQDSKNTITTYFRKRGNNGGYEATESSNYPIVVQGEIPSLIDYRFTQALWNGTTITDIEETNKNLRINALGFGALGFSETTTKDNISGLISDNKFDLINTHQDAYANTLTLHEERIDNTNILKKEYQYDHSQSGPVSLSSNNIHYINIHNTNIKLTDYINGTTKNESFLYDKYGNILNHETKLYDGTNAQNLTLHYSETELMDNYLTTGYVSYPALCEIKKTTKTLINQPSVEIEEHFEYNNATGFITKHIAFPNTIAEVETQYTHDNYGNITQKREYPAGLPERITSFAYSDNGLFKISETNPLGWSTSWTHDMFLQVPVSKTDINNLTTTMSYDAAGRLVEKIDPNQNTEEWFYEWDTQNKHPDAITIIRHSGNIIPEAQNYYDALNRKVMARKKGRENHWYRAASSYNMLGLLETEGIPYREGQSAPIENEYTYDALGRKIKIESSLQDISFTYPAKRTIVETNNNTTATIEKELDPLGNLYKKTDASGTIEYIYNSFLNPIVIKPPVINETVIQYDDFGRKIDLHDPAAGRTSFGYDALNRQVWHRDARGNETEITYDLLDREITKETASSTYIYTYDNQFLGKLDNVIVTGDDNHQIYNNYDQNVNLIQTTEIIGNETVEFHYDFNSRDQLTAMVYPNGLTLAYTYDQNGSLNSISSPSMNMPLWEWVNDDFFGNISQYNYGSQIPAHKMFNQTTGIFESENNPFWGMNYTIDPNTMNVTSRSAIHRNLSETFAFDPLDRLEEYTNSQTNNTINVEYDNIGAIDFKTDAGNYLNNNTNAALAEIEQINTSKIAEDAQSVSYNCFNSVSSLSENGYTASFSYGCHFQRVRMSTTDQNRNTVADRYYFGNGLYERDWHNGAWRNLCYINAPTGQVAVYIEDENRNRGDVFFTYTDYLGSVNAIADRDGHILEEFSYDAWGNRRDPRTWEVVYSNSRQPYPYTNPRALWGNYYRGYTNHEHLDVFGLINMNGRLYDPVVGQMVSPDAYVQNPENAQNFNRFSYCWNNPLKYTDPSGEIIIETTIVASTLFFVYFTEAGYDFQKYLFPVAVKVDLGFGTHQTGSGVRVSLGLPQKYAYSYRKQYGISNYSKNNQLETGSIKTYGEEHSIFGVFNRKTTNYSSSSGKFNQKLGEYRFGLPGLNLKASNDLWGDKGDRWRTGAGKINIGVFSIGLENITGDPGLINDDRKTKISKDGKEYYEKNEYGDDPDNMRQGVLYVEFMGTLRIGVDSESIRRQVQDKWIHDPNDYPRFRWVNYPNRFYFQIGSTGSGLY